MTAFLPLLFALPLFSLARQQRKSWPLVRISNAFLGAWLVLTCVWLLWGSGIFLMLSSWAVWGALFIYIAGLGDDDGDDPWYYDPEGPFLPEDKKSPDLDKSPSL